MKYALHQDKLSLCAILFVFFLLFACIIWILYCKLLEEGEINILILRSLENKYNYIKNIITVFEAINKFDYSRDRGLKNCLDQDK